MATSASTLSLGILRFFLDITQSIDVFSVVSLSLSLVTFILSFIAQVGMVLFPALRRAEQDEQAKAYGLMKEVLSVGMPALYLLYFPIVFLIETWLPDYQASIEMFLYLIPICVFEGKMQMVFTTYFKVLREEKTLLWVNLLGVGISALGSVVGLIFLGSVEVALVMLAVAYAVRSFVAELYLNRLLDGQFTRADFEEFAATLFFLISVGVFGGWWTFLAVCAVWGLILLDNKVFLIKMLSILKSVPREGQIE